MWARVSRPGLLPSYTLLTSLHSSAVNKERHFSCEDCDGNVSGGFDASASQVGLFTQSSSLSSQQILADFVCWAFSLVDFAKDLKKKTRPVTVFTLRAWSSSKGDKTGTP